MRRKIFDVMKLVQECEKAVDVGEFKGKNGQWVMNEPFFYETDDGTLVFGYVRPEMDEKKFARAVAEGRIWRVKRTGEIIEK